MEFNLTEHNKLWLWLAVHPTANKRDWPGWAQHESRPLYHCFACEYVKQILQSDKLTPCKCYEHCPLDWELSPIKCCNHWYAAWSNLQVVAHISPRTHARLYELATIIANTSAKKGIKTI